MQDVSMTVASTVSRGGEMAVAVSSSGPVGEWLLRVCEAGGEVRLRPTRLDTYGEAVRDGDSATLECRISTVGYEPGEYMVDLSPDGEFEPGRTVTRRVVVEAAGQPSSSGEEYPSPRPRRQEPLPAAPPRPRSGAWYIAPILLGLLGGIIAYIVVRHDDPRLGKNCLIVGLVITVMVWVVPLAVTLPFAP